MPLSDSDIMEGHIIRSVPACTVRVLLSDDQQEEQGLFQLPAGPVRRHVSISERGSEISGYGLAELLRLPAPAFHALCLEEDREKLRARFSAAVEARASYEVGYRIRRADGSVAWIQESGDIDRSGMNLQLACTVVDRSPEELLKEEVVKREQMLAAIADANSYLINEPDLFTALNKAAERVGRSTGVDRVYLFANVIDANGDAVTTSQRMEWNSGQAQAQLNNPDLQDLPIEDFGPFMEPLKQGDPFRAVVAEIEDTNLREFLSAQDILSILVLPITREGRFWGFLGFDQCSHVRIWSPQEESILRTLCAAMASAVSRDNLARELELELVSEQAINKVTAAIMPLEDALEVFWTAVEAIPEELGLTDCVIYQFDPAMGKLAQVAARTNRTTERRILSSAFTLDLSKGIVGRSARTREAIFVADTRTDPDYIADDVAGRSELAVPILADDRLLGVIDTEHPEVDFFRPRHMRFLRMLSNIIAVKILELEHFAAALEHQRTANELQRALTEELERSLKEREAQLNEITAISRFPEVSPLPVMRLDTHGTLTYANAASAPLMEAWKATVGAPVDKNILVQLRWAAARGAPVNQFLGDRVFKVMANPVAGFDFMNVYATEETAMHKLKDLQEDMIRQERMSILGQLMAGIAHELNTPLGAISGSINNLLRTADRWFREDLPNLDKQDIPLIDRHARKADLQAGDHYNRQKALRNALRANHPQLAEDGEYASMLTDMGWHTPLNEEQEALLRHPRATDVLKTIHTIVSISSSASIIRFASERSGRIVKALRSYSHKDLGEFPVAFDIHRQITDLQQLFATGVRKGIKFAVHSDGPLVINGFEDQLSHVWTNLYNNAIQAMGNQGDLVVRIGKSGDDAIVSFSNNGPMIPPNITERIFEPMFTTKARGEGTGMGLSIARSIVHEHGGVITCVSGPDETTFTVRLPMDHRRELPGRERGPAKVLN